MNAERLIELTKRAEKANRLAEQIKALNDAEASKFYLSMRERLNGYDKDRLPEELLIACYTSGRLMVIADKERELEELLGKELDQPDLTAPPKVISERTETEPSNPIGEMLEDLRRPTSLCYGH